MNRTTALLFILILIFFLLLLGIQAATMRELQFKIDSLSDDISLLFWETGRLHDVVAWMVGEQQKINKEREQLEELTEFLLGLGVKEVNVTAYAPHDNQSGICNDGDPTNTATGTYPQPGTFAVNPNEIPYGSNILLIGDGWAEKGKALDTGAILRNREDRDIDRFVWTHKEARAFGIRSAKAVVW